MGEIGPTTGIHLLNESSYSYSVPSSVSSMYLLSIFENETRGSSSKAEGDWGNPRSGTDVGLCERAIVTLRRDAAGTRAVCAEML